MESVICMTGLIMGQDFVFLKDNLYWAIYIGVCKSIYSYTKTRVQCPEESFLYSGLQNVALWLLQG